LAAGGGAATGRREQSLKAIALMLIIGPLFVAAWASDRVDSCQGLPVCVAEVLPIWAAINLAAVGVVLLASACGEARTLRHPHRRRAALLQLLIANLLGGIVLIGGVADHFKDEDDVAIQAAVLAAAGVGYGLIVWAWRAWRRAQRLDALSADEVLRRDPRAPVLYLRSFADDGAAAFERTQPDWRGRWQRRLEFATPEQELADLLDSAGPLIAIGKPGESLPELGAARLYVSHDRWQAEVLRLMARSALVVLRLGESAGVLWELEQVLALVPRQRLMLVVLHDQALNPQISSRLRQATGVELQALQPDVGKGPTDRLVGRLGCLIGFDECGAARLVEISGVVTSRLRQAPYLMRPWALPLRAAWLELHGQLGRRTGVGRPSQVAAFLLASFVGFVGAHWWYLGRRRRAALHALPLAGIAVPDAPIVVMLPLVASVLVGYVDGLRMVWVSRDHFDSHFVRQPSDSSLERTTS
jgi:hypothetical protein